MPDAPRPTETRIADTLNRLEKDIDAWVATADPDGGPPGLIPLSFDWDGHELLLSTLRDAPAGRNMRTSGVARLALGGFRDVVIIESRVREMDLDAIPAGRWESYARRAGWDPREAGETYAAYLATPVLVQAWRELDEIPGRTIMRDGEWVSTTR